MIPALPLVAPAIMGTGVTGIAATPALGYLNAMVAHGNGGYAEDGQRQANPMKEEFTPEGITALFEQASRLIHGARFAEGLTPAQWTALRYFAEAPPFQRTMASLARFQGLTLAPVTRTVRTLMDKKLVDRHPNPRSKRADLIIVNKAGRQMLNQNPRAQIAEVIAKVPTEDREVLVRSMHTILDGLLELGLPQFDESLLQDDNE